MITLFQWFALISIGAVAIGGGWAPLVRRESARSHGGFPRGEAFSAGVFLALSMLIMLPASHHLLTKAHPKLIFPLAFAGCLTAFVVLLALGHWMKGRRLKQGGETLPAPAIPLIMTVMIAIPSFLLGTALAMSSSFGAVVMLIAILVHKGSAGFALALNLVRSTLSPAQTWIVYLCFACSTPAGILVGDGVHLFITGYTELLIKGGILGLASGVFLYMATLHEFNDSPLITTCSTAKGFAWMFAGLLLTAAVKLFLGLAHAGRLHP